MTMQYKYFRTYSEAVKYAQVLEAQGYSTAVLISGEVRYWK